MSRNPEQGRAPETGDAEVDLPISYKGEPIDIGFNPQFLMDALRVIKTPEFELELGQAISLNKKILGERDNLFYSFRELLKAVKKKKNTLSQSLQLLSNEDDAVELQKLAKEYKVKVQ